MNKHTTVTWAFDSQDKPHRALDEGLYLLPSGWNDSEWPSSEGELRKTSQGQPTATHRPYRVLWWGTEAVTGGEAGELVQHFHKTIFYAQLR